MDEKPIEIRDYRTFDLLNRLDQLEFERQYLGRQVYVQIPEFGIFGWSGKLIREPSEVSFHYTIDATNWPHPRFRFRQITHVLVDPSESCSVASIELRG